MGFVLSTCFQWTWVRRYEFPYGQITGCAGEEDVTRLFAVSFFSLPREAHPGVMTHLGLWQSAQKGQRPAGLDLSSQCRSRWGRGRSERCSVSGVRV